MAYNEMTIRARIVTVLESVTDVGLVYDYSRWAGDWGKTLELFKTTIDGVDQIRGWEVTFRRLQQSVIGFQGGGIDDTILVTYSYRIRGFLSFNDADESEKTMTELALAIVTALEADTVLQGEVLDRETPVVAEIIQEERMFAGILCNYVEMLVQPQEVI